MNPELDEEDEDVLTPPGAMVLDERRIVAGDEGEAEDGVITLDPVEIRGRRRGYDTVEDVADSIRRKGAPARAADLPTAIDTLAGAAANPTSDVSSPESRRSAAEFARSRRSLTDDIDEALGVSSAIARAPDAARDVPIVGDVLGDWLESGTAGTTGAVMGATFGHADELAGLADAAVTRPGEDSAESYRETRDRLRAEYDRARAESPVATGFGEAVGGTAAALALPGVPSGGGLLNAVGSGMAEGLAYGALSGAGHSTADDAEGVLTDAIDAGLAGGAFGAAGGAVGNAAGRGVDAARRFASRADDLRIGATVGSGTSPLSVRAERDISALPGGTRAAADYARRTVPRLGTVEDSARALTEATDASGRRLGEFTRELDEAMPEVPVDRFTGALDEVAGDLEVNPGTVGLASRPRAVADDWRAAARADAARRMADPSRIRGEVAREGMGTMRSRVDHVAAAEGRPAAEAELDMLRRLRSAYDDAAEEALGPGTRDRYRSMRNEHAIGSTLERYARPAAMRAARSPGPGLRGALAGVAASAGGTGPVGSMVAAEGAGFLARRRPAMEATAAETVRAVLERAPERLGDYAGVMAAALRRGPEVFLGRHRLLMERDPEYRATVEAAAGEPMGDPASLITWDEDAAGDEDPMSTITWDE